MVCKYCVFATQHACRTKQLLNTLIFWHLSYTFSQRISAVQWVHHIMLFRAVPSPAQVWSVQLGVLLEDLPLHSDFVNCVLFSPSAPHILSAADNGIIKVSYSGYFWWGVATYLLSFHLCIFRLFFRSSGERRSRRRSTWACRSTTEGSQRTSPGRGWSTNLPYSATTPRRRNWRWDTYSGAHGKSRNLAHTMGPFSLCACTPAIKCTFSTPPFTGCTTDSI